MPANVHVTVSPTLTVPGVGVQRLSLPSGCVPSIAWMVASASATPGSASTAATVTPAILQPHHTTSICSIIALSACSSAWQWNTYLPP